MIAAISPTSLFYEDTHNTLTYASRAMGIQFNCKPNTLTIDPRSQTHTVDALKLELERLRNENEKLKHENEKLKDDLRDIQESKNCLPFIKKLEIECLKNENERLKNDLRDIQERIGIV